VRRHCQAISGVADETMPRRDGWRFLVLGRQLERVTMTSRLLAVYFRQPVLVDTPLAFHDWVVVLKAAAALEAFRKAENVSVDPVGAVEYLLTDVDFPRSVQFCLTEAEELVADLGTERIGADTRRLLGRLRSSVEFCDLEALFNGVCTTPSARSTSGPPTSVSCGRWAGCDHAIRSRLPHHLSLLRAGDREPK
jgi:uncharacterized alpha-E superfamily protein